MVLYGGVHCNLLESQHKNFDMLWIMKNSGVRNPLYAGTMIKETDSDSLLNSPVEVFARIDWGRDLQQILLNPLGRGQIGKS